MYLLNNNPQWTEATEGFPVTSAESNITAYMIAVIKTGNRLFLSTMYASQSTQAQSRYAPAGKKYPNNTSLFAVI